MNRHWLIMIALGLSMPLAGCNQQTATHSASDKTSGNTNGLTIRIGSVAPLTGPQAHLGKDNDNGARLAVEDLNAKGVDIGGKRYTLQILSEDDQADPKTATVVAQKLADEQINGVVGHLNSGTTIPASKIYADAGIPQISPSATAIAYTAQGYKTAFRVMTNDAQQGKVLGQFIAKRLGAKRVAIIDDRTAYGQGLADEVEKSVKANGAQVIAREFTTDRSTDFMAILTSIKGKQPDAIFFGGMDAQAGPMIKQLRQLGIDATFLGGDGAQSHEFLQLAGPSAEGVVASAPGLPIAEMPGGKAFIDKFTAKYGKIQNYAPYAYDAVFVMVDAMQRAGSSDPARYLPEMAKTRLSGVTGPIEFDAKGDIKGGAVTMYTVKDGQWQRLETFSESVATPK